MRIASRSTAMNVRRARSVAGKGEHLSRACAAQLDAARGCSLKAVAQVRVILGLLVVTLSWPAELNHSGPARAGSRSGSQQVKRNADGHE